MNKVFWRAVRKGWGVCGFNLGFDISRLSLGWRRSRKGGFRLILSKQLDYKTQTWKSHPYRPEINLEAKDARTTFITRGVPRFRKDEWPNPGRFLDVSTLLFSLFDKHMSLDQWCAEFQKKGYPVSRVTQYSKSPSASLRSTPNHAADVPSSKVTDNIPRNPAKNSRIVAAFVSRIHSITNLPV
jgi:hypothetical protein